MAFGGRSRAKLPIFTLPPEVTWVWQVVFCGHWLWNLAAIRGVLPAAIGGTAGCGEPVGGDAGSKPPTTPLPDSLNHSFPPEPEMIRIGADRVAGSGYSLTAPDPG